VTQVRHGSIAAFVKSFPGVIELVSGIASGLVCGIVPGIVLRHDPVQVLMSPGHTGVWDRGSGPT
jgi:hypothetical protein